MANNRHMKGIVGSKPAGKLLQAVRQNKRNVEVARANELGNHYAPTKKQTGNRRRGMG